MDETSLVLPLKTMQHCAHYGITYTWIDEQHPPNHDDCIVSYLTVSSELFYTAE